MMVQDEVKELIRRLHEAQCEANERIQQAEQVAHPDYKAPNGWTVEEMLRTWAWHFFTHHRDLVRARGGPLNDDLQSGHLSHFIRRAHAEFGEFVGELACMSEEELDLRPYKGGMSVREIVEHVIKFLREYIPENVEQAQPSLSQE